MKYWPILCAVYLELPPKNDAKMNNNFSLGFRMGEEADLTKEDNTTHMLPIVHAVNLFFEMCGLHLDNDNND